MVNYKFIISINYRIPSTKLIDPKKINKKKGPTAEALLSLRMGNKIVLEGD